MLKFCVFFKFFNISISVKPFVMLGWAYVLHDDRCRSKFFYSGLHSSMPVTRTEITDFDFYTFKICVNFSRSRYQTKPLLAWICASNMIDVSPNFFLYLF